MPGHKHMQSLAEEREQAQKLEVQMQSPVPVKWEPIFGERKCQKVDMDLIARRGDKKQLGMQASSS